MNPTRIAPAVLIATLLAAPLAAQETAPAVPAPGTEVQPATPPAAEPPVTDPVLTDPAPSSPGMAEPGAIFTPPEGYSLLTDWAGLTAETLTGAEVAGPDGASIGKITDVELGSDGAATGIIADIGGFLGMGTHTVRLGSDQITLYRNADGAVIAHSALTKEALEALPEYTPPS